VYISLPPERIKLVVGGRGKKLGKGGRGRKSRTNFQEKVQERKLKSRIRRGSLRSSKRPLVSNKMEVDGPNRCSTPRKER